MDDLRRELNPVIADWNTTVATRQSSNTIMQQSQQQQQQQQQQMSQQDWSNILASSQAAVDTLSELSMGSNGAHPALSRQYLGLALDSLQQQQQDQPQLPIIHTPPPQARMVQSARQLLRSGSDMTASRRDRRREMMQPQIPYQFDQTLSSFGSGGEETVDMTRSQYEKIKQTIKLLSDQIKDIHEVLQKMMPVLKKILTGPKEEISTETIQGMLDQLLPRIEENLSQHLHNVQNKVLMNIQTSMDNQEAKYQQLCEQVNFLKGGHSHRDQEVLSTLSQLSELIYQKESQYDQKLEEMKKEMNKRMEEIEAKMSNSVEGDAKK
eukprot:TRINITY_DN6827_c1_g1_i1.p1 TRINITY_DN6827_c1_g1~~TRINITY_DN6827_c1_g1_i1.p1  ORF type:complete len:323 (+),score=34.32 TRINITY_DN6827_c1_g1_i1:181-1149(+)